MTTASRSPSAWRWASSRWSYERYVSLPRTRRVGTRASSNGAGVAATAVRGDDRSLRVAVAPAAVLVRDEMGAKLLLDELSRRTLS